MMMKYMINIALFLMTLGGVAAQNSFNVQADTNRILIGGQIKLQLKAEIPVTAEIKWPSLADSLASFEIVNKSDIKEKIKGDIKTVIQDVWITSFDSGYAFIPAINAQVGEQLMESQAIGVLVGMPQLEESTEYYDIKDPIDPPLNWWLILGVAHLLLAIGTLIYYLRYRAARSKPHEVRTMESAISPYDRALNELALLQREKIWQEGRVKEYYSRVTQVLRQYLEHQMGKPAMESTADEVTEIIRNLNPSKELLEDCHYLMSLSVGVKFAKLTPTEADHEKAIDTLEKFLEAYKPIEEKVEDVSISV